MTADEMSDDEMTDTTDSNLKPATDPGSQTAPTEAVESTSQRSASTEETPGQPIHDAERAMDEVEQSVDHLQAAVADAGNVTTGVAPPADDEGTVEQLIDEIDALPPIDAEQPPAVSDSTAGEESKSSLLSDDDLDDLADQILHPTEPDAAAVDPPQQSPTDQPPHDEALVADGDQDLLGLDADFVSYAQVDPEAARPRTGNAIPTGVAQASVEAESDAQSAAALVDSADAGSTPQGDQAQPSAVDEQTQTGGADESQTGDQAQNEEDLAELLDGAFAPAEDVLDGVFADVAAVVQEPDQSQPQINEAQFAAPQAPTPSDTSDATAESATDDKVAVDAVPSPSRSGAAADADPVREPPAPTEASTSADPPLDDVPQTCELPAWPLSEETSSADDAASTTAASASVVADQQSTAATATQSAPASPPAVTVLEPLRRILEYINFPLRFVPPPFRLVVDIFAATMIIWVPIVWVLVWMIKP